MKEGKKNESLSEAHLARPTLHILSFKLSHIEDINPILHWRLVSRLKSEILKSFFPIRGKPSI